MAVVGRRTRWPRGRRSQRAAAEGGGGEALTQRRLAAPGAGERTGWVVALGADGPPVGAENMVRWIWIGRMTKE
jgi:hypothetical protein